MGRLDTLINNAGITKHMAHGNLDGLSAEDFHRLFGVNTIGPFQMVRAARPLLEAGANASGRASAVVNVSSVAGISGIGSSVAYAASKGALNVMTISLARALAPLIRVNAICPGYMDTPWFTKGRGADGAAKVRDAVVAKVPLKVASTAEDVASAVCFLATSQSGNMTGGNGPHRRRCAPHHLSCASPAVSGSRFANRSDVGYLLTSLTTPLATSLFQMNSTTSAPMVAVMKPAPWPGL